MAGREPEFDYYELSSVLGEGGMGVVYKARDRRTGLPVAIKVMSKRLHDPELQFRFVRENEILASLNHRNIVRCYDVTRARDGTPSLVMEFVDGVDFRSFEGLPYPELLPLMVQTLLGMRYLRGQNIVHRDLSSNNILVCLEGDSRLVKIVDFGIAKILYSAPADGDILTQTGQFLGKFSFASPELLLGSPFDWKSDVYSLGVIFYRLLTGQFPVKVERSGNYFEWVMAHQKPHTFDFEVPEGRPPLHPELVETVREMLAHDPEERPASWDELIAAFDGVQRAVFAQGLAPDLDQLAQLPPKRVETIASRPGGYGTPAGSLPAPAVAAFVHSPSAPVPPASPRHTPSPATPGGSRLPSDDIPTARSEGAPRRRSGQTPAAVPARPLAPEPARNPVDPAGPAPTPPLGLPLPSAFPVRDRSAPIVVADPADVPVESGSLTEMVAKPELAEGPPAPSPAPVPVSTRQADAPREASPSRRGSPAPERRDSPVARASTPVRRESTPPKREVLPPRREVTPGRLPEIPGRVPLTPPRRETLPLQEAFRPSATPVPPVTRSALDADGGRYPSGPVVRPRPRGQEGAAVVRSRRPVTPVIVQGRGPGWVKVTALVAVILAVFAAILYVLLSLLGSVASADAGTPSTTNPGAVPTAIRTSLLEG